MKVSRARPSAFTVSQGDQSARLAWAARPRERATKAERGAGGAAAVPRSGAALVREVREASERAGEDTEPDEHGA